MNKRGDRLKSFRAVVLPVHHSDWWLITPDLVPFVEKVIVSRQDWERRESQRESDSYHDIIWQRLRILADEGVVEVRDFEIDEGKVSQLTQAIMNRIKEREDLYPLLLSDLRFAYGYWIGYNKTKLYLLCPVADSNRVDCIVTHLNIWMNDYELMRLRGADAFRERPELLEISAKNIISRVVSLVLLSETFEQENVVPFEPMLQFAPFLKYVALLDDERVLSGEEKTAEEQPLARLLEIEKRIAAKEIQLPFPVFAARPRLRECSDRAFIKKLFEQRKLYEGLRSHYNSLLEEVEKASSKLEEGELDDEGLRELSELVVESRDAYPGSKRGTKPLNMVADILSFEAATSPPPSSVLFGAAVWGAGRTTAQLEVVLEALNLYGTSYRPQGLEVSIGFLDSIKVSEPRRRTGPFWR